MRSTLTYQLLLSILALILLGSAIALIPLKKHYVFIDSETDRLTAFAPLVDTAFQIKYTHSIHLSNVLESYRVLEDNTLMATEVEYEDFNIGMPSNAGEGERFVEKDGSYFIKNMTTELPEFRLLVGDVDAGLSFIVDGKEIDLKKTLDRGKTYTFRVQRLSFFQQLEGVNLYER
ncbi:DUF1850 domain-containing protein [Planococcus salinus]|uniref:DUF1850 domain-containing protein n=1 Tax=Planococcus salinus TaxID=1848460 RepID=A0A3M8P4B2_9BACL|nr:DUF1850 domain-containing protein [Planococcus salinus]RNF38495.1 DUF1850 domain-containing protein [Planococcus salinus]